jgi:hypothetical protein
MEEVTLVGRSGEEATGEGGGALALFGRGAGGGGEGGGGGGGGPSVIVSPYPSGYTLGGAAWRITRGAETVVYAPTFNHRSERIIGRAALVGLVRAPSALIVDA